VAALRHSRRALLFRGPQGRNGPAACHRRTVVKIPAKRIYRVMSEVIMVAGPSKGDDHRRRIFGGEKIIGAGCTPEAGAKPTA
jgi:hypothetical protein